MHSKSKGRPKLKGGLWATAALMLLTALILSLTPAGQRVVEQACYDLGFNDWRGEAGLLEVHVISVGKADAILVRSFGSAALIDAGRPDCGDTVTNYLLRHNVRKLDYLIMSHPDSDHTGGMSQVLDEIEVGAFVWAGEEHYPEKEPRLDKLLRKLQEDSIEAIAIAPGDGISMGLVSFTAVGPAGSFEDANNSSLVLRMDCLDFSALFCGDIEKKAEEALLFSGRDIDVELLKVAHHGSNTSSGRDFLEAASPKYAVISTGLDRSLLPRDEVLERIEGLGAEIYRTDTDGNIVFIYDGLDVRVRLDKEERTDYETVEHRPF